MRLSKGEKEEVLMYCAPFFCVLIGCVIALSVEFTCGADIDRSRANAASRLDFRLESLAANPESHRSVELIRMYHELEGIKRQAKNVSHRGDFIMATESQARIIESLKQGD